LHDHALGVCLATLDDGAAAVGEFLADDLELEWRLAFPFPLLEDAISVMREKSK
jgi:hypothetical protein